MTDDGSIWLTFRFGVPKTYANGKPRSVCSDPEVARYVVALPLLNGQGGGCPRRSPARVFGTGVRDNQLRSFEHIGVFQDKLPKRGEGKAHPHLVNPYETQAPLEARVRSYLHVNCSTCHVLEGGGNSSMELDLGSSLDKMQVIDVAPTHDRFGIEDARLVAPGSPERSVLLTRISRRGTGQMPPLVSTEVDRAGVEMIAAWIRGLARPGR